MVPQPCRRQEYQQRIGEFIVRPVRTAKVRPDRPRTRDSFPKTRCPIEFEATARSTGVNPSRNGQERMGKPETQQPGALGRTRDATATPFLGDSLEHKGKPRTQRLGAKRANPRRNSQERTGEPETQRRRTVTRIIQMQRQADQHMHMEIQKTIAKQ